MAIRGFYFMIMKLCEFPGVLSNNSKVAIVYNTNNESLIAKHALYCINKPDN